MHIFFSFGIWLDNRKRQMLRGICCVCAHQQDNLNDSRVSGRSQSSNTQYSNNMCMPKTRCCLRQFSIDSCLLLLLTYCVSTHRERYCKRKSVCIRSLIVDCYCYCIQNLIKLFDIVVVVVFFRCFFCCAVCKIVHGMRVRPTLSVDFLCISSIFRFWQCSLKRIKFQ